jgi:ELWxxDGT repeat protein
MDSAGMSNFTYYSMSNGLILNNKDTTKKSLLINYSEIRVDTIRTFFIPKNFRIVDFEHKIFEVVDSGLVTLFRTNEYSQIIDTINTPDYESTVIGNKLYYYKTLIDKNSTNPYRTYKMWDLYSYDLESYQRALLVPNCLRPTGNSALLQHTFKNGKLVFFLTTQEYGSELYVTDGTQQGSSLLKDINQGPASAVLAPLGVNPEADFFCFNAISDKYGRTIWKTDGTELNTVPIFSFELPTVVPEIDSYDQIFVNKGYILFENKNIVYSLMSPKINPIVISNNYKIFDNIFSRDMGYSSSCWIFPSNILKDKSGNIYVSGNSRNYSSYYGLVYMKDKSYDTLLRENGSLGFVIKYNSSGQKLFTKYFTDDMDNEDIYSAIDSTGNIICFFSHNEHQPSYNNYSGLIKMTATGDTLWIKKFSHELNTNELDIQCDSNDNIYLLNNGENSKNISITKISPEGKNLIYKEFKQSVNINRINSSIISNRLYIGLSEHDEKLAIQNSKSASLNKIIASDLSLSILNEIQLNGEGWSTLSSINKGLGEDIIVSGSFRGTIDLSGNILSSAVTKDSNMTTSYLSHFDSELNLKYVKNLYPDPYLINSTCIFENKSIYTVGIYYNCNIDSTIYPNLYRYPKYNKFSVATKQYDYWGNELASFYYSKYFENYRHWLDPKVIEFNNKPLVYDVYQGKIGYIPDAYYSPYEDKILLLQPEQYYIYSDNWGNNYIKAKFDTDANIKLTVKVIDITGKHILSFPLNLIDGTQQLSIPYYLTHGCYLLVIQDGTHTEHHKFMR